MKNIVALAAGALFAVGLGISGMTQPNIVKGFLDVFGEWKWDLVGVMAGAIAVHAVAYRLIRKRPNPLLEINFQLPSRKDIDKRLVLGAVLFGLGWGWGGICPGPGLVSVVSGNVVFLYFVGAMLLGMKALQIFEKKFMA